MPKTKYILRWVLCTRRHLSCVFGNFMCRYVGQRSESVPTENIFCQQAFVHHKSEVTMNLLNAPLQELAEYEKVQEILRKNAGPVEVTGCAESQKLHLISGLAGV